jgi:hypothetical protein
MCMRIDRRELLRAGSVGAAGVLLRPSFDGETVRVQGPSSSVPPPTVTPFPKDARIRHVRNGCGLAGVDR